MSDCRSPSQKTVKLPDNDICKRDPQATVPGPILAGHSEIKSRMMKSSIITKINRITSSKTYFRNTYDSSNMFSKK